MVTKNCLKQLNPLFVLGSILGILPAYSFKKKNFIGVSYFKLYTSILLFTTISLYFYEIRGRILNETYLNTVFLILKNLQHLMLYFMNCSAILQLSFIKFNDLSKCLELFSGVDRVLFKFTTKKNRKDALLIIDLAIGLPFVLLLLIYSAYIAESVFKYYVINRIQYFYCFVIVMFIRHLACGVEARLRIINTNFQSANIPLNAIKNLMESYAKLNEIIDIWNQLFGWIIVLLLIMLSGSILECLDIVLAIGLSTSGFNFLNNYHTVIFSTLQSCLVLVQLLRA